MKFSANLGFLWKDLPFLDRIDAAARAGFDALEFHDDGQRADRAALKARLRDAGLPVVGLNTQMGPDHGMAVSAHQKDEIAAAVDLAADIGAGAIHTVAGDADKTARGKYREGLETALELWSGTVLIEPLCRLASPHYHLWDIADGAALIDAIDHPRLKLMFDMFHIEEETGDILGSFQRYHTKIGHIQIASHPNRTEPDAPICALLPQLVDAGYDGAFGCEYRPLESVEAGLGWRKDVLI